MLNSAHSGPRRWPYNDRLLKYTPRAHAIFLGLSSRAREIRQLIKRRWPWRSPDFPPNISDRSRPLVQFRREKKGLRIEI